LLWIETFRASANVLYICCRYLAFRTKEFTVHK
jgi:hypothetical protein